MQFKTGKLPKRDDPRTLQFAKYATALPKPPKSVDFGAIGQPWGMMGNDCVGDCTCAAAGHLLLVWARYALNQAITVSTADVLKAYSAITGYDPADPSTDRGADMLDVLNYWRTTGIAGHKIGAFVEIDPANKTHVQQAIWLFGGVYAGVELPNNVLPSGSIPPWTKTNGKANPENGHCVPYVAYTGSEFDPVTWAAKIKASWSFEHKYTSEAYAMLSPDWRDHCPDGFDGAALDADLAAL